MFKKCFFTKQIRQWLNITTTKNCVCVPSVEGIKIGLCPIVFHWENFNKYKKLFYKYGTLLNSVTVLSTLWYHNSSVDDIESNLAQLMHFARIALENGDVERAEAILELSIKISEEHNVYTGLPFIYDILASLALSEGKIEKAELLLVEVIEKLSSLGYSDNNHNIIDFRLRLARMYSSAGSNALANIGFQNCLDQQKAKIVNGDLSEKTGLLYVHILFWFGVHKIKTGKYSEAKQLITNAYDYSSKIKGLSPKQEMIILYTLADLNSELGDFEVALTSMLDAIILGKGIGSVDLPICYLKLGDIYQKLHMTEKAKYCYEEAKSQGEIFGYGEIVTEAITALAGLRSYSEESNVR